ncbi:MAG TPA: hypothetical protein VFX89_00305 [Gammaproteobacteria bacterium]|nr:hypothetical protein [Gammaproteobacteria bacterium]
MRRFILGLALVLAGIADARAARTIEYVEGAYEITLRNLILPAGTSGNLSLRTCATCERINLRVNTSTKYSFRSGDPMSLVDFQLAVATLRQQPGVGANGVVFYNLATKRVTRVVLDSAK